MRKFTSHNPVATLIFFLSICLTSFIIFYACRKVENIESKIDNDSKIRKEFFKVPGTIEPLVKAISQSIYRQDQQRQFVPALSKKAGFPVWDKAIVLNRSASNIATKGEGGGGGETGDIVLIPFVKGEVPLTNAVLIVGAAAGDTTYKLLYSVRYEDYGFDYSDTARAGAKNVFHLFALFDNQLFGYTKFLIKDRRIITGRLGDTVGVSRMITTLMEDRESGHGSKMTVQLCNTFTTCRDDCYARTTAGTVYCPCGILSTLTICTTIEVGGDGTGIGGGGGDGGGGWENENPCREVDQNFNPCGGGDDNDGWVPVTEEDEVEGMEHFLSPEVSLEDNLIIRRWKRDNIDTSLLDSCRKVMIAKMLSTTHAMGRLLTKLDKAMKDSSRLGSFNIKYKITSDVPPGLVAIADSLNYDPFTRTFTSIVKISDSAIKNATDIFVSQSILHETVHCYLSFILHRIMTGAPLTLIQSMDYPSMFDTYVDSLIGRNLTYLQGLGVNPQYQHNFMAEHLLTFFANALAEFDDSRINDDEYYWFMAWKGLQQTQAWTNHWPNWSTYPNPGWDVITNPAANDGDKQGFQYALTRDRLENIHNAILAELTSNSNARGKKPVPPGTPGCYQ